MVGILRNIWNRLKLIDKVIFIEMCCLWIDYRLNWMLFCFFIIINSRLYCGVFFVNEMKENLLNSNEVYVLFF